MDKAELDFEDCLRDEDAWQQALSAGAFDEPPAAEVAAIEAGEVNGDEHWRPRSNLVAELTLQQEPAPVGWLSLSPPPLEFQTVAHDCALTVAAPPRPSGDALLPELLPSPTCSGIRRRLVGNAGPGRRAWSQNLEQLRRRSTQRSGAMLMRRFFGQMGFRRKSHFIYRKFRRRACSLPRASSDSQEALFCGADEMQVSDALGQHRSGLERLDRAREFLGATGAADVI